MSTSTATVDLQLLQAMAVISTQIRQLEGETCYSGHEPAVMTLSKAAGSVKDLRMAYASACKLADNLVLVHVEQEKEIARLREALQAVYDLGHNDDCILCGFKDRKVLDALKKGENDGTEE